MVDRYRIWPEGFAAHMRPAKPVDMVFADEHDAEIADIKAENERLERERDKWEQRACTGDDVLARTRDKLSAAERALAERAGGVKVRPLPWAKNGNYEGSLWANCEEINRHYTIEPESNVFRSRTRLVLSEYGDDEMGLHPTIEAAKAAAQADYERRIRSALTTEPAAQEGRQEAVAWRYRWRDGGDWKLSFHFDDGLDPAKYEQEPLFTRPAEQAVTEVMRRIRDYADKPHADRYVIRNMAEDALKAAMEAGG